MLGDLFKSTKWVEINCVAQVGAVRPTVYGPMLQPKRWNVHDCQLDDQVSVNNVTYLLGCLSIEELN